MPVEGVEPPRACAHLILSQARLPFRHTGERPHFPRPVLTWFSARCPCLQPGLGESCCLAAFSLRHMTRQPVVPHYCWCCRVSSGVSPRPPARIPSPRSTAPCPDFGLLGRLWGRVLLGPENRSRAG